MLHLSCSLLYGYVMWPSGQILNLTEWDILRSENCNYSEFSGCEKLLIKFSAGMNNNFLFHRYHAYTW